MRGLIARALLGFAFLVTVLAAALLVPAGSLDFWQAWAYLGVFALCTLAITAYLAARDPGLLARRVEGGPMAEPERRQQVLQGLASAFFLAIYVVAGLDHRWGWSRIPPAVSIAADALVAMGFLAVFLVFRANSYTSAVIDVAEAQTVVTTGPYRIVRHPMYAGAMVLLVATPPALGSWLALPLVAPLVAVVAARAVAEEALLAERLPGYDAYRRAVRYRLVPWIW